jgi:DNA replication protein DnaC
LCSIVVVQDAFFKFGGVPQRHRTDSLAAAVRNHASKKQLTQRYEALMDHYRCQPQTTNARCANENGDVESLNGKIKDRIDQALLLRGNRNFESVPQYAEFLEAIVERANANRQAKSLEEQSYLKALPASRLDTDDYLIGVRVSKHSTIHVRNQVYSVPSRLIDTKINVRVTVDSIIASVGDVILETMPRLIGKGAAAVNYRHIIDSLLRKPGAFANYRYHEQMFPRTVFRIAYDVLGSQHAARVRDRCYLVILHLAATESEEGIALALTSLIDTNQPIEAQRVRELLEKANQLPLPTDVSVPEVNLADYDQLIPIIPINDKDRQDESTKGDDNFLDNRENVLIFGKPGTGKSHALCALAEQLIHRGRSLLFTTCSMLVQQLLLAKQELRLPRMLKTLASYEGLIIDDLGYVQQNREGDGSAIHVAGGSLRAKQRVVDEQLSIQQMGSNIQGRDDHRRGHRPTGTPQCDH